MRQKAKSTPKRATRRHQAFDFQGPFFTTAEMAAYLKYRGSKHKNLLISVYKYLKRNGIRTQRRGRTLLIKKLDIDRSIGLTNDGVSS